MTKTFYYIKLPNGEVLIGDEFALALYRTCKDGDKIEVLSEVPSYEQWQEKLEENTKLKKLLKECKERLIYCTISTQDVQAKINQVLADNQIQANTVACNKIQENK